MKNYTFYVLLFGLLLLVSCKAADPYKKNDALKSNYLKGTSIALENVSDTTFINLKSASKEFIIDMKYATNDNFMKQIVYDCDDCYLRYKTIKQLINANTEFIEKGYRIKIFDCYRPLDIQKKMWKILPNADYVADPKRGSIHNRGGAVDVALVDTNGKELDMGTAFDFFGEEASHHYQNLPDEVKKNRAFLKEIMLKHSFKSFDSEWWHYNLAGGLYEKIANFKWECE
jgi:D-alanyl-D-alanine dipeptidase